MRDGLVFAVKALIRRLHRCSAQSSAIWTLGRHVIQLGRYKAWLKNAIFIDLGHLEALVSYPDRYDEQSHTMTRVSSSFNVVAITRMVVWTNLALFVWLRWVRIPSENFSIDCPLWHTQRDRRYRSVLFRSTIAHYLLWDETLAECLLYRRTYTLLSPYILTSS